MRRGWATVLFLELALVTGLEPYTEHPWAKELYAERAAIHRDVVDTKHAAIAHRRAAYDR